MAVRTRNVAHEITEFVSKNDGMYSWPTILAMFSARSTRYQYLFGTGVLVTGARGRKNPKRGWSACVKLGPVGEEKLNAQYGGGSMAPIIKE